MDNVPSEFSCTDHCDKLKECVGYALRIHFVSASTWPTTVCTLHGQKFAVASEERTAVIVLELRGPRDDAQPRTNPGDFAHLVKEKHTPAELINYTSILSDANPFKCYKKTLSLVDCPDVCGSCANSSSEPVPSVRYEFGIVWLRAVVHCTK